MDGFDAKVAELTRATTTLLANVNVSATSLNADASTASTKASDTATNTADALAYRNTAETYKDNTATYSATATGTVSYSGIAAIAESKAITAVDVFVYDTSKDSDGGAWRHRCQHTSWYNETLNTATRGSRREFPAVAVIVAESNKVTIYDGDDPTLPMWMVLKGMVNHSIFLGYSSNGFISSITMRNGIFVAGVDGDTTNSSISALCVANFVADSLEKWDELGYAKSNQGVDDRNNQSWDGGLGWYNISKDYAKRIVNQFINDVAMTVLPDAPIDQATGLPIPTIAVATDGGVSVITDSGAVYDVTFSQYSVATGVGFFGQDLAYYVGNNTSQRIWLHIFNGIPTSNVSALNGYAKAAFDRAHYPTLASPAYLHDLYLSNDPREDINGVVQVGEQVIGAGIIGSTTGKLSLVAENVSSPKDGMVSFITSSFNTGWMVGDIKGAFLSDTDTTSLVASGELVTNGTFDTDSDWTKGTGWSIGSGVASINNTSGANSSLSQVLSGVNGKTYAVSVTVSNRSGGASLYVYWGNTSQTNMGSNGTYTFYVTLALGSNKFYITANNGVVADIDNISVRLADADRSVNKKGLVVNGTITRTPVATGADLVSYGGFSTSNYLEQPYNSDLDFGTGDFCYCVWINRTSNSVLTRLGGRADGIDDHRFEVYLAQYNEFPTFYVEDNNVASFVQSSIAVSHNAWTLITAVRENNVFSIYVNGRLGGSFSRTIDLTTENNASFFVGGMSYNGGVSVGTYAANTSLALFRISATAPSAEQIAKIYEDEKVLFTEGAQATLYGTSSAVTALAYDEDTELLHVGTSQGRSVFQGLARVDNTTTAVDKAISAVDGLVVEE